VIDGDKMEIEITAKRLSELQIHRTLERPIYVDIIEIIANVPWGTGIMCGLLIWANIDAVSSRALVDS